MKTYETEHVAEFLDTEKGETYVTKFDASEDRMIDGPYWGIYQRENHGTAEHLFDVRSQKDAAVALVMLRSLQKQADSPTGGDATDVVHNVFSGNYGQADYQRMRELRMQAIDLTLDDYSPPTARTLDAAEAQFRCIMKRAGRRLGNLLCDEIESMIQWEEIPAMVRDLASRALAEVDWNELATDFMDSRSLAPTGCEIELYVGPMVLVEDEGFIPEEYLDDYIRENATIERYSNAGNDVAIRWTMPGYLDCGSWYVGDDVVEAFTDYFEMEVEGY